MATPSYRTIDARVGKGVDVEMEIKRSRFLTRLRRVATEEDAREVIAERRKAHFDASHNCTAFVLGSDSGVARSSDDGEPAGTAGVPMLNVLHSNGLSDVVAVVTRYFGGIKLGGGGLVRAYSDAVAQAVEEARGHASRLAWGHDADHRRVRRSDAQRGVQRRCGCRAGRCHRCAPPGSDAG